MRTFEEVLDNAVKYTPSGGKISVSVVQWEMYVEVKVTDTGRGISESNQAAIFRRFYREEEVHDQQGVGIGLYLAREIVTRQGGYIKVVEEGEFVAVVGTSGSGKSTLLHMMGGLDTPTSGSVMVRDKELAKMNDEQLTIFRRRNIGFVFQNYNLVSGKIRKLSAKLFSGVFGIDSAYLEEINKTLNLPIDTSAFEQGKVVLLSKTVEGLIQPGQEITIQTQNGQHSFIVANGYLNEGFRAGGGNERGTAPDLYIERL